MATWLTTSTPRGVTRPCLRGSAPTVSVLMLSITSGLVACRAGTSPKSIPAMTDTVRANPSTRGSSVRSSVTGIGSGRSACANRWRSARARRTPPTPPSSASRMLSVRSCRISTRRRAPRASRTAISRRRARAWASRKLARLAQAISRTRPTTASRSPAAETMMPSMDGLTWMSLTGVTTTRVLPGHSSGSARCMAAPNPATTVRAWVSVAPSRRRPVRKTAWLPRSSSSEEAEAWR